jgi:NOL1/NOP2/sun family putative RNA methylase
MKNSQKKGLPDSPLIKRYEKLLSEPFKLPSKRECLRINTLLAPANTAQRIEVYGALLTRVPFLPDAYWYESSRSLGATAEYLLGHYYLQEAASQLPALVLSPTKHATVLDMTASPGSKTTHLAALMNNTGTIVALELKSTRMDALVENLERCGVTNTVCYRKDARFATDLHVKFTHVLLDAPCSGNPVIEPDYFERKTLATIAQMQSLQRELIKAAVACLAPDGTLVYSTCSLEPEENEENIAWTLAQYPNLELEPTGLTIGEPGYTRVLDRTLPDSIRHTRRLWPQKTGTQGFFVAKFRNRVHSNA